jgi:outer membrane protein OmpA-like peptidoglycan-associated protein
MVERAMMGRPVKRNEFKNMTPSLRVLLVVASGAIGLAGCSWVPDYANPVEWYRDLSGNSKNDDKGQARNAQNLDSGTKEPYPNLANVPPPPSTAMSGADRAALEKGLVADRTNAKYSDQELRAGRDVPSPPAPATQAALNQATPAGDTGPAPAATPVLPPTKNPPDRTSKKDGRQKKTEAPPTESAVATPTVRGVPQGDSPHEPPSAPGSGTSQHVAALKPPVHLHPPGTDGGHRTAVSVDVTEIAFPTGMTALPAGSGERLTEAVKLLEQNGGKLRIVGYGPRDTGTATAEKELDGFGQALDRANAVAQELAKLGVPADKIAVEAAPAKKTRATAGDRAEIFLEY